MIEVRRSSDRGRTSLGWLESRHTFSFGSYQDPRWVGLGPLRVINDDIVAPAKGFAEHPHRDMEIISYVVDGALAHRDSTGAVREVVAGGVQRMSAGRGITHSEFNPSKTEPVRFLQVWIEPQARGLEPGYQEVTINARDHAGELRLVASPDGRLGSARLNQNACIYAAVLWDADTLHHPIAHGRRVWVQVVEGEIGLNGLVLHEGDGAAVTDEPRIDLIGRESEGQALIFDLP